MATNDGPGHAGARHVSASEARDALFGLDADGAELARRLPTPWPHLLAGSMLMGLLVGADLLPSGGMAAATAVAVLGIILVRVHHRRQFGIAPIGPLGRRPTRLMMLLFAALLAAKVAVMIVSDTGIAPWWAALPVSVAVVTTSVLGARYHAAMREAYAHRFGTPR